MMRVPRASMRGNTALAYDYEMEPEPELIEIPIEQRKTLLQLNEKTCRWPVGDPGQHRIFLLRWRYRERNALLLVSLPCRLSASHRPPAGQAAVQKLSAATTPLCLNAAVLAAAALLNCKVFAGSKQVQCREAVNSFGRSGRRAHSPRRAPSGSDPPFGRD